MTLSNHDYCHDVAAVLVTYNPDLQALQASIAAVAAQVANIFIIDNASVNFSLDDLTESGKKSAAGWHFFPQSENLGIGAGHNIGIWQAQKSGAAFVLLLDQDSQVGAGMVRRLRSAHDKLVHQGSRVAALGPRYRDCDNGTLSRFVKVRGLGFALLDCKTDDGMVEADFLVSSGSLLPLAVIETVGLMDARLFIDHVDTEWCFRAKAKGFQLFGVCDAVMTHALGEQRKEIWFLRQRTVPFHRPFRYYYIFRNSMLLYRRSYMPWRWKLADMLRSLKIMVFFGLIGPHRWACIRMMAAGLMDGLKGLSGKHF
ncbi:MAG: glycosyltransferase family 2 protein [Rhodoferax sp.]